ncbi:exonuclease mut-7 homolog isoform X4 [Petromyzon marinus]|uniref:exonuclease mut-7 homolog isoform X4 n=1 Tax=Petromyzon marinus TaxID=7757 RepID=UPI003F6E8652
MRCRVIVLEKGQFIAMEDGFVRNLEELWNKKQLKQILAACQARLETAVDPRRMLVDILEVRSDWRRSRAHLAHHIITEFSDWVASHHPQGKALPCDWELQARAIRLLSSSQGSTMDPFIHMYQLETADRQHLISAVKGLQKKDRYQEAAHLAKKMHLQPYLNFRELCTPLLLQDKLNVVEGYVSNSPELQQELVRLLDSWCHPDFNLGNLLQQYPGLQQVKHERMHPKSLSKFVTRLLDTYKIDSELCPNVKQYRALGAMKFLFYQKYGEKAMDDENWNDHISVAVGNNPWLQEQLVMMLCSYRDVTAAARWARRLKMPHDRLPSAVLWILSNQRQEDGSEEEESAMAYSSREDCYQLPVPLDQVIFIDNLADLEMHLPAMLQPGCTLGVDMEWRPSFGVLSQPRVALVQVARRDRVLLLDLPRLSEEEEEESGRQPGQRRLARATNVEPRAHDETAQLQASCSGRCEAKNSVAEEGRLLGLMRRLFSSGDVLKLGYDVGGDIQYLLTSYPMLKPALQQSSRVLDIAVLQKQVERLLSAQPLAGGSGAEVARGATAPRTTEERGLSLLVLQTLGKALDKRQQLSEWERRPLTTAQLLYAASDAYCLLEVYDGLLQKAKAAKLSVNLEKCMVGKKVQKPRHSDPAPDDERLWKKIGTEVPATLPAANLTRPPESCSREPMSVRNFAVVCDSMLQGLGRYLRCLGVDVHILENIEEHRKAAEIARAERRVILTCGLPYQTLRSQVGEDCCYFVDCKEKAKDQAKAVLRHFNVQVTPSDIFSRCKMKAHGGNTSLVAMKNCVCNGNRYMKISGADMARVAVTRRELLRATAGQDDPEPGYGVVLGDDLADEAQGCVEPGGVRWSPTVAPTQDFAGKSWRGVVALPGPEKTMSRASESWSSRTPRYYPACFVDNQELDANTASFADGTALLAEAIPPGVLETVQLFYCCVTCGKVFWEGSHFSRILSQFADVLSTESDTSTFYES